MHEATADTYDKLDQIFTALLLMTWIWPRETYQGSIDYQPFDHHGSTVRIGSNVDFRKGEGIDDLMNADRCRAAERLPRFLPP